MNVNLEQLKELLEMQRVLDDSILKEHGHIYDGEIAEKMKIALFVELGEMMQELPTQFKHWKKTAKDNMEKALEEYVDALHFALSLFNFSRNEIKPRIHDYCCGDDNLRCKNVLECLIKVVTEEEIEDGTSLSYLFDLGNILGFTWDEIYKAYKDKNAVNYERLRNGY